MLIEAILFPVIIGFLMGGKFKNFLLIEVKCWFLIPIAGFLEFLASFIRGKEIAPLWQLIDQNVLFIQLLTYSLLIIVLSLNIKEKGFLLILIGTVLNFIVIMANQGRMPVDTHLIEQLMSPDVLNALKAGKDLTHSLADSSTRLLILGDIIHLQKPYPLPKSISIGDLFLTLGVTMYVYSAFVGKRPRT